MTQQARVVWARVHASTVDLAMLMKNKSQVSRRALWVVEFDREFDRLEAKR